MMGQMMGSDGGLWIPVLLGTLIVLALVVIGMVITRASRAVDRGVDDGRADRAIQAATRPPRARGDDQIHALRERYARGEISHAEFLRDLDSAVRAEQRIEPGTDSRPARPASGGKPAEQSGTR